MKQRAKVLVRTRKEDRERLTAKSPTALAEAVVDIGERMKRDARRQTDHRARVEVDSFGREHALRLCRESEARQLAFERAELLAICDEMRARIDLLLAGKDIAP